MTTDAVALQPAPAQPRSWGVVLGQGLAVYFASGLVGFIGGVFCQWGLAFLLFEPELARKGLDLDYLLENYEILPTAFQALFSEDTLKLLSYVLQAPCALLMMIALAPSPWFAREYLGLRWPTLRQLLTWGVGIAAVDLGSFYLAEWLGFLPEDDRYVRMAQVPQLLPVLFVSLVILCPLFEEVFFRGFLLEGFRRSKFGEAGAVVFTSSVWALMHPGGPAVWIRVLIVGVLLGVARLRTGSTYLLVLIHGFGNLLWVLELSDPL